MDFLNELLPSYANLSWAAIGVLLGWYVPHLLSKDRDKANRIEATKSAITARRREFCAFLRGWRADFDYRHMQTHGYQRDGGAFVNGIPSFVQMADLIRGDLTGDAQKRFGELVTAISARRGGDVIDQDRYAQLLHDFDELISLVESKPNDA